MLPNTFQNRNSQTEISRHRQLFLGMPISMFEQNYLIRNNIVVTFLDIESLKVRNYTEYAIRNIYPIRKYFKK